MTAMKIISKILLFVQVAIHLSQCESDPAVYQSFNLIDDNRTVLLGGLFPVHSGSDCTTLEDDSVQLVESMAHTINIINNNVSLLPDIRLTFAIRDTCSSSPYTLRQAFQFVQKTTSSSCNVSDSGLAISGVVGAHFSRVSIDLANLLRLYRIPQISYISTADVLGDKSRFKFFFRTVPPDSLQSRAIADIIIHFNWTFVLALYSDDEYGNGGINALFEHLKLNNLTNTCIAAKISLAVGAKQDAYDDALRKMDQQYLRNATVVVLFGHPEAANGMMEAIKRNGDDTFRNLMWLGTDSWGDSLDEEYRHIPGGILSVIPRAANYDTFDNYFRSLQPENHSNCWLKELWTKHSNCNTSTCIQNSTVLRDFEQASHLTLVSDAVMAFAHAIHRLVSNNCPKGILCDKILEERSTGRSINGTLLREELFNISFTGFSTNNINFDKSGKETGAFNIRNLKSSNNSNQFYFETVGLWDNELTLRSYIQWPNNAIPVSICSHNCSVGSQRNYAAITQCCWTCSPCLGDNSVSDGISHCRPCDQGMMPDKNKEKCIPIPITYLSVSNIWSIFLLTLTLIGLLATACIITVFLVFHKKKVIKASSREVSAILLAGLALCFSLPFFFVIKPSPSICAIRRFSVGFSFAMCFSSLLIKTNRIYRIFNQKTLDPSKPPRFTSPLAQVVLTLSLISIQGLAAAIWLGLQPPSTRITYRFHQATLRCSESPITYIAISLGYNFILLVLSTYNAFLARKVPENFNEAKYINVTVYSLCIIWFASITTYFATLELGPTFQAVSLMAAIILSATTILVCIFVPKIVLLVTMLRKKQKVKQSDVQSTYPDITRDYTSKEIK